MNIKDAIAYAQVSLKQLQEENKKHNKQLTAKQLGEVMWLSYYRYDEKEVREKAQDITGKLELNENG